MTDIIFNADDLGLSRGINQGIVEFYKNGVVNSASLMTTTKYFEETVALIKKNELSNIGLHFNLTEGRPLLTTHKTLVDLSGNFTFDVQDKENIDYNEVESELKAQYIRAIHAGVLINHLDSHHHVHMNDRFKKVFLIIAQQYKMPLRKVANTYRHPIRRLKHYFRFKSQQFYTDAFSDEFYGDKVSLTVLKNMIDNVKGSIEIMCHPGYRDEENGIYNLKRQDEMNVLLSDDLKKYVVFKS